MGETTEKKENTQEVWDNSWEIPVITVYAPQIEQIKAYSMVRKVSFPISEGVVSLIIGNKLEKQYARDESKSWVIPSFLNYLALKKFEPYYIDENYFTNNIFFDWLNIIDWSKVIKTKELYDNKIT